ncbi:MAG: hypothetical protein GWP19_05040 [Planctomycetia bacterium]|nr:hypothetical protein [Planctomycetia bacterium]
MEVTYKQLLSYVKKLEKYKIKKVNGKYIIKLYKPSKKLIKAIEEGKIFKIEEINGKRN